jgi:hypothetical protein
MATDINFKKSLGLSSKTRIDLPAFDASYNAILARATFLGYTLPTLDQQVKQNKFLVTLKANGIWYLLDVLYVFAQNGGSAFATLNWKNPSANQCVLANSPTFITNGGFQGNDTSNWIDTNFNPATQGVNYTLNNASRYFFPHAFGAGRFDGNGLGNNSIFLGVSGSQRINSGANLAAPAITFNSTVNPKSIHRTSSTEVTAYNDNIAQSVTQTSVGIASSNQLILNSSTNYSTNTCAGYAMGAELTVLNDYFVTAWNTYKSSL